MNPPSTHCDKHNRELEQEPCELCAGTGVDLHAWGEDLTCPDCGGDGVHWFCRVCRAEAVARLGERTPEASQ